MFVLKWFIPGVFNRGPPAASVEQPVSPVRPSSKRKETDFFEGERGEVLDGRYRLHVKLGGGVYSTTWLVDDIDSEPTQYYAAKLLSRDATKEVHERIMLEVDAMKKLRDSGGHPSLPMFYHHFEFLDSAHIGLIMDVHGLDVGTFRRAAPQKALAPHIVRVIMRQVVAAIEYLHAHGIVHTDVKPDNILFRTSMSSQEITTWLAGINDPSETHALPNPWTYDCSPKDAENIQVCLVDLGQCQWIGQPPTVDQFSAFSLRAPEVVLRTDFGPAIDIWSVGCLIFEMLVGRWLFHPIDGEGDWTVEDDHLAKMMELTGEAFPEDMLARSSVRDQYFDNHGGLLRVDELYYVKIEDAMRNYKILSEEDIGPAARLVRSCCRLDPGKRPTAETLAKDPWFYTH